MKRSLQLVLAGLLTAGVVACGGKPAPTTTVAPAQPNADSLAAAEKARADSIAAAQAAEREAAERLAQQRTADSLAALGRTTEAVRTMLATMVHFDFDKSVIRPDDAAILDQKVAILRANGGTKIRIAGHTDERGSDEYNLALGNRRATSAKQYLVSHGIEAGRIETQSFGKERPLDPGHTEASWSKNRRDEFEVAGGGDALRQP